MNTLSAARSRIPGRKEIHNRRHDVSTAFPVKVTEVALAEQTEPSRTAP